MVYHVLGIETGDYVSKKTGQPVRGTNLHCTYPTDPDNKKIQGDRVERLYVPERVRVDGIQLGDNVEVYFNRFGSVDSVQIA